MVTTIITLLIYICFLAILGYIILYVLRVIGVPLPARVIQLLYLVFGLIVLLLLYQALFVGGLSLPRFAG